MQSLEFALIGWLCGAIHQIRRGLAECPIPGFEDYEGETVKLTRAEKVDAFRALHEREGAFLLPNPWDTGTAVLLSALGFEALATTSAGCAFSLGKKDHLLTRDAIVTNVAVIAAATDLPVNADLENGFGDAPEAAAETIRRAASAGAAGGSIEDATGREKDPIYEKALATERIRAAAEAARQTDGGFVLTARCENYLHGRQDIRDTIGRLQAYQEAGADVLYAPGLTKKEDIAAVVSSVDRPVNVLAGVKGLALDRDALAAVGVKRISVGSALSRVALTGFLRAAQEMREKGTFGFAEGLLSYRDISVMFPK
jgi:2-methylisocitrate lyase-like PEP mutase family enzyme